MRGPRKQTSVIPDSLKYLLRTGECVQPGNKPWPDGGGWMEPFKWAAPWKREALIALWHEHKDTLKAEWASQGHHGISYIERVLESAGEANSF